MIKIEAHPVVNPVNGKESKFCYIFQYFLKIYFRKNQIARNG